MTNPCVIFDIDGTLCDTIDVDDDCYRQAAGAALGVSAGQVDWTDAPHPTDSGIALWLWQRFRGRAPTPDELNHLQVDFLRRLEAERAADARRFQPVRAAPEFLDGLRGMGVTVGIGTGGWRRSAELKLRAADLPTHLLYATADDAEARVDIFSLAWTRATAGTTGCRPTVLIGDSVWDLATARQFAWAFVGLAAGAAAEQLRQAGSAIVVPDYADLDAHDILHRAHAAASDGAAA
jgi:phosphoglycolate phosphatase-like HAD superfamily hydrolase